jgi:ferredoxin-NADP reductase
MPVSQKLPCVVERIVAHGERVYTVALRPHRVAPRFRAGQFLHLALDPYDPSGFWPESRVFSIASSPADRTIVTVTYAVHGAFTTRMERELAEGATIWIKLPYGDFVVDGSTDVVLLAGGTGITAFTAFLEELTPVSARAVVLAYGARRSDLLIYRDTIEACARRLPSLDVVYFVEEAVPGDSSRPQPGRISVAALWPRIAALSSAHYYIAGPPLMLRDVGNDLRDRGISSEAIHIDAWE